MDRHIPPTLLVFALCASTSLASAAEPGLHNDLDGDGRSDVLWRNSSTGAMLYWSAANASHRTAVRLSGLAYNVAPGFDVSRTVALLTYPDWDTPARSVIVVRDRDNHDYDLFFDGSGGYGAYSIWVGNADWRIAGAGDFDGNGVSDLLYRNQRDGRNGVLSEASWADWAGYSELPSVANLAWAVAGTGDFDGDGNSDILWRNSATGQNIIWRSANFSSRMPMATVINLAWKINAIGDFDGDGRSDIFWRNGSTGDNQIWYSANAATWRRLVSVTDPHWQVTATGDFDGDGKFDLFWRNTSTGANTIWRSADAAMRIQLPTVSVLAWSTVM